MGQSNAKQDSGWEKNTEETEKPILVSFIPNNNNTQFTEAKARDCEDRSSFCSYCAKMAVIIISEESSQNDLLKKVENGSFTNSSLASTVWNDFLKLGFTAFNTNEREMRDPDEIDDEGKLEEGLVCHNNDDLGITKPKFMDKMKESQYTVLNLSGETVLVFRLGNENGPFLFVDTHKKGGFYRINDLDRWVDETIYPQDIHVPPMAYFSKQK
tara:strand:- start:1840 stop:2478 length:639 start_codon:yes stop_codon:yes gene_type:complete